MRVLVIGANGKTGRRVVKLMAEPPEDPMLSDERLHEPVAMIRDPDQRAHFTGLGVETVVADLEEDLSHALEGVDAVIFAAGSGSQTGPDKTVDVDQDGAIRSVERALEAGVKRYVMLSSIGADPESEGHRISHYYRAKGVADEHLQASGLEHVIVRPGRLIDEPGRERIRAAVSLAGTEGPRHISRDDVASVLLRAVDHPGIANMTFEILEGDIPVQEALERLSAWKAEEGELRP